MGLFRRKAENASASDRWIVVGLGNPGERYADNRHNAGYMVVEVLLGRVGASLKSHRSGALAAETRLEGERVVLARPVSYMNESGQVVRGLLRFYKEPPERLVLVHDELDIPFGEVRVKFGGGTAGHNGVSSVASHLGSRDFVRVRVGVSRPPGRMDPADYVLRDFPSSERKDLPSILETAADAVERVVASGVERAMNEVNTRD
jgi:PTH1 family peptidyl-tRNA hydrolase